MISHGVSQLIQRLVAEPGFWRAYLADPETIMTELGIGVDERPALLNLRQRMALDTGHGLLATGNQVLRFWP